MSPRVMTWILAATLGTGVGASELRGKTLKLESLVGGRFVGADLTGATIVVDRLVDTDFTGAKLAGAVIRAREARGNRFVDADLTDARLEIAGSFQDNLVRGGKARGLSLAAGSCEGSRLERTDLTGARLRIEGEMRACDLAAVTAPYATIEGVMREQSFTASDLRGAVIVAPLDGRGRPSDVTFHDVDLREAEVWTERPARVRFSGGTRTAGAIINGIEQ